MKEHQNHNLWLKLFMGGLILVAALWLGYLLQSMDWTWLTGLNLDITARLAIIAGIFLFKALTMVIFPSTVLYLLSGCFFPVETALLIVIVGMAGEFTLNYYMGCKLGRRQVQQVASFLISKSGRIQQLASKQLQYHPLTIFLLRFLPGPPNNVTSLLLGSSDMPFPTYFWSSMLGAIPKAATVTIAGTALLNPFSWQFLLPTALFGILVTAGLLWFRRHQAAGKPIKAEEGEIGD